MIYGTAPFSMTLNDPFPRFQGHAILWPWISLKRYEIQTYNFNEILIGTYTSYSTVSFRMTLSDLEWLSKVFDDTKQRAASLRQLSFLLRYRQWNRLQHLKWRSNVTQDHPKCHDSLDHLDFLSDTNKVGYTYFRTKSLKWP